MVFCRSNDLDILLIRADLSTPWCWAVGILHESLNRPSPKSTWSPGTYHRDCGKSIETTYDALPGTSTLVCFSDKHPRTYVGPRPYCPRNQALLVYYVQYYCTWLYWVRTCSVRLLTPVGPTYHSRICTRIQKLSCSIIVSLNLLLIRT